MNQYDEAGKVPHFHFVASQPDPTPQDVAAPTLEQLAESGVDKNIRREIRVFNDGGGWMWAYYNDPMPPYSSFRLFANKDGAIRSARRFIASVSNSKIVYLHGDDDDCSWVPVSATPPYKSPPET